MEPPIHEVLFPPDVAEKLWRRHGLTQLDVEAVVFDPDSEVRWDVDDTHGGRVIVAGNTTERHPRRIFIALALADPEAGTWTCITAFLPTRDDYGTGDDLP